MTQQGSAPWQHRRPPRIPISSATRTSSLVSRRSRARASAVRTLVVAKRFTPAIEELLSDYPHLTREEIEEAFAFYEDHRAEIDRYIAENDAAMIADIW
jgi:hypothetical protein